MIDEKMMTIHFKANLRYTVGDRVGMLHWITDPACSGFIIAYDLGDNHVLINNFDVCTPMKHSDSQHSKLTNIKTVKQAPS